MVDKKSIKGIVSAVVTPFNEQDLVDYESFKLHAENLLHIGVNGLLVAGTTGEGPSLSLTEQLKLFKTSRALEGDFYLLGCVGTPSLTYTIDAIKAAFESGVDGVVVWPPYYYKQVTTEGLTDYYKRVLDEAVPSGKFLMVYDIPQVTGIRLDMDVFNLLYQHDSSKFLGVKDSSGKVDRAQEFREKAPDISHFVGTDTLLLTGLNMGSRGCITAGSNVLASLAVNVYQAFLNQNEPEKHQQLLTDARKVLEMYSPFPPVLKALLHRKYQAGNWNLRLPLLPLSEAKERDIIENLLALNLPSDYDWLK